MRSYKDNADGSDATYDYDAVDRPTRQREKHGTAAVGTTDFTHLGLSDQVTKEEHSGDNGAVTLGVVVRRHGVRHDHRLDGGRHAGGRCRLRRGEAADVAGADRLDVGRGHLDGASGRRRCAHGVVGAELQHPTAVGDLAAVEDHEPAWSRMRRAVGDSRPVSWTKSS